MSISMMVESQSLVIITEGGSIPLLRSCTIGGLGSWTLVSTGVHISGGRIVVIQVIRASA